MNLGWRGFAIFALILPIWGTKHASAVVVRYEFTANGANFGTIDVRLYHGAMPNTVANFLHYVDDNDWDGSFIHRRAALADSGVAVIQGGGYYVPETGLIQDIGGQLFLDIDDVPTDAAINDEPGGKIAGPSNLRGTIAMAKSGPNTAMSQWYFNTVDNTNLDDPMQSSGGFSAFGRVLGNGMSVIDDIWNLDVINVGVSPVTHVPVFDIDKVLAQVNVLPEDVIIVADIRRLDFPDGDYDFNGEVNANDYTVWRNTLGSRTNAAADGNGNGVVDAADYVVWRRSFNPPGAGSGLPGAAVPEPNTLSALVLTTALMLLAQGRRAISCR